MHIDVLWSIALDCVKIWFRWNGLKCKLQTSLELRSNKKLRIFCRNQDLYNVTFSLLCSGVWCFLLHPSKLNNDIFRIVMQCYVFGCIHLPNKSALIGSWQVFGVWESWSKVKDLWHAVVGPWDWTLGIAIFFLGRGSLVFPRNNLFETSCAQTDVAVVCVVCSASSLIKFSNGWRSSLIVANIYFVNYSVVDEACA